MRTANLFSSFHGNTLSNNTDNLNTAGIADYVIASNQTQKDTIFSERKIIWAATIQTSDRFALFMSFLEPHHIGELYHAFNLANTSFLNNATEFAQVCIKLDIDRIKLLCELIKSRLDTRGFIDNAQEFCKIFSVFASDENEHRTLQLKTIFETIKFKLNTPSFFQTLDDFVKLFCLIPTLEDKAKLFEKIKSQLGQLDKTTTNINDIHQNLTPKNKIDAEMFRQAREIIFRFFIKDHTQLNKAFHAALFLILDHYPGNQPDKLRSMIDHIFSDSTITELNTLLEKTENAMRFMEFNITSTRLRNAITHLINNLKTDEKIIGIDYIIQLAQNKKPLSVSFFALAENKQFCESVNATACAYQPEC